MCGSAEQPLSAEHFEEPRLRRASTAMGRVGYTDTEWRAGGGGQSWVAGGLRSFVVGLCRGAGGAARERLMRLSSPRAFLIRITLSYAGLLT